MKVAIRIVSLKSIEKNLLELCFRHKENEEKACEMIENNYKKLIVNNVDLDEINTVNNPQVKYHATGLNGTFDKKTKCISKLGLDYAAFCGTEDTQPC